jgi:hypothetical protein
VKAREPVSRAAASAFSEWNHTGAEFLMADLDTAMVFLDVAETSGCEDTVQRNRNNARRAYDMVLRLFTTLKLSETDREAITAKLAVLKKRLEAAGQQLGS